MFDLFDLTPVNVDPYNPPLPPKRPKVEQSPKNALQDAIKERGFSTQQPAWVGRNLGIENALKTGPSAEEWEPQPSLTPNDVFLPDIGPDMMPPRTPFGMRPEDALNLWNRYRDAGKTSKPGWSSQPISDEL